MKKRIDILMCVMMAAAALLLVTPGAYAQDTANTNAGDQQDLPAIDKENLTTDEYALREIDASYLNDLDGLPSVLFVEWETAEIRDARSRIGEIGFTDDIDLANISGGRERPPPLPEERYIALGGLLYKAEDKWTLWLNGQRVTPGALPSEVIGLKVFEDYIELKWFDEYTSRIYPIRLRPYQRFHLDTRVFLPG